MARHRVCDRAAIMSRFGKDLGRRLGLVCTLLLALTFAAPAFASHVCAESEACAPNAQVVVDSVSNADPACEDCGPACANGCCHAPHPATAPTLADVTAPTLGVKPIGPGLATAPPSLRPTGPERPPRV